MLWGLFWISLTQTNIMNTEMAMDSDTVSRRCRAGGRKWRMPTKPSLVCLEVNINVILYLLLILFLFPVGEGAIYHRG